MSLLERIYYFHARIQNNRYPNSHDLTEEFEISPATAHRDIAYMRDRLLAPLNFDQRKNGYYYEEVDFRLPFEDSPRIVLFLSVLSSMAAENGLEALPELKQLQKKLASLVTDNKQQIEDLIHCEWVEVEDVDKTVFDRVINSLLEGKQLDIVYGSSLEARRVEPLKLVHYQGRWYLLAWCTLRQARRLFHLSRIKEIVIGKKNIEHHLEAGDDYLSGVFGIFKGKARFTATIALSGRAADTVRCQHWHPDQQIEESNSGIILKLPVADDRELIMKILQFGEEAEVLSPKSLRDKLQKKIVAMAKQYSDSVDDKTIASRLSPQSVMNS